MGRFRVSILIILVLLTFILQISSAESIGDYKFLGDGDFNTLIFDEIQSINAYNTYLTSMTYDILMPFLL
jgi:hypothetical protein